MNCTKIHYLLSLNLDGRLSSTKREVLLHHLDTCEACRSLDAEMRGAQDLALQLPGETLNTSFSDTLWERIRAGEGTPDAVFHQPISIGTRVRYLATGAAAAAAFLVALNWLGPNDDRSDGSLANGSRVNGGSTSEAALASSRGDEGAEDTGSSRRAFSQQQASNSQASSSQASNSNGASAPRSVASGADAAGTAHSALAAMDSPILSAQPVGLSPSVVAQSARKTFVRSFQDLKHEAPQLRRRIHSAAFGEQKQRIAETVRDLRVSASLMLWMAEDEFIQLPGRMHAGLELARQCTTILERAGEADEFLLGLKHLDDIDPEQLESQFSVVCCDKLPMFIEGLTEQLSCTPETGHVFSSMIVIEGEFEIGGPSSTPLSGIRIFQVERSRR